MKSEEKTEECNLYCQGCEMFVDNLDDYNSRGAELCDECNEKFEDKTGHCSINCCVNGNCDQTC